MLLKMYCKEMNGKQLIAIGQAFMMIGIGCSSGTILLNRFTHVNDFILGFLAGFGAIAMGASIVFNINGLKKKKTENN